MVLNVDVKRAKKRERERKEFKKGEKLKGFGEMEESPPGGLNETCQTVSVCWKGVKIVNEDRV